ncbi:pre-B-cell leukemia transcription factor 2-like [Saccostrea cucullata]|uniref:pre-B-cell leukemia transcription factor 2-like n=1 Tax=Saccostrea cuccullata TaxID=36930 RepID=UPI002ED5EE39
MAANASSPSLEVNSATTLEDIIKATIIDDLPSSPTSTQTSLDISPAETRFDECLDSLTTEHPTPEKSDTIQSDLQLALQCLLPSPANISANDICSAFQFIFRSEAVSSTPSVLIKSVQPEMSITHREHQLWQRFNNLRHHHPQQINDLSSFYKYQSAQVETDRYCALHQNSNQPHHIRESINHHYNIIHHRIMDRVENSLQILEESVPKPSPFSTAITSTTTEPKMINLRTRPSLSQKSVQLMEQWYYSHLDHPYPSSDVIEELARRGGIKEEQVKKWFSNKRNRSRRSSGVNKRRSSGVNKSVPCFW